MTTAVATQRKERPGGQALAIHADYEALKRKIAAAAAAKRLGPWQALNYATHYAQLQTERLQLRIEALEERLGIEREAAPERTVEPTPSPSPKAEGKRIELALRGSVTPDKCAALCSKIRAASKNDEIVLRLTSPGGDHESSVEVCQALLEFKGRVRTIAEGQCSSAAATIFLAGDKDARLCTSDAHFLIHAGSFEKLPAGWTQEFARGFDSAQSDDLAKIFSRRTGKSWFAFRKMMRTTEGETLSAARAHELGIVSDILPTRVASRRRAKVNRKGKRK